MLAAPIVAVEWCLEWMDYFLGRMAIFKVLAAVAQLSILVGVYSYLTGADARQQERHYEAWQVISLADGLEASAGRTQALEDLNDDGVSLARIDLAGAWLYGISLPGAELNQANMDPTNLNDANLEGAYLGDASFNGAHFISTNMSGSSLRASSFQGAVIRLSDFSAAELALSRLDSCELNQTSFRTGNLNGSSFAAAYLYLSDFSDATLEGADLSHARLRGSDFRRASLTGANLKDLQWGGEGGGLGLQEMPSNFLDANLYGVRNPPDGFLEWALEHGAWCEPSSLKWRDGLERTSPARARLDSVSVQELCGVAYDADIPT